jgi:hypothetical protein
MTIEDDRQAIADLVRLERFHRDRRRWHEVAEDYIEDSRVKTTWFEGTGREFAAASREMAQRGRESIHLIAPSEIRVNSDRALCESNAQIVNRSVLHDVEVDMVRSCRFFSRRIWAYAISRKGYEIGQDELGDDRPDLLEPCYAAAERWLAGEG